MLGCGERMAGFAGPDLAVAYVKNGRGTIIGRCVCWPEKKLHGRVYGAHGKMQTALKQAGYRRGTMSGARLDKYLGVIPYLDDGLSWRVEGKYVVLIGPTKPPYFDDY